MMNEIIKIKEMINDSEYPIQRKELTLRALNEFKLYMLENKIDIKDLNKKDIVNIASRIKTRSYGYMNLYIDSINIICDYIGLSGFKINQTRKDIDFNMKSNLIDSSDRYFTKKEIQNICNLLINAQDKFIIYGLFLGICGKERKELLEMKTNQIDLENNMIKLEDKIIYIDDFMKDICIDILDPVYSGVYYKYIKDENEGTTNSYYELNFESEYVIKSKPYIKNNNGLEPMKVAGINQRFHKLKEITEIDLSAKDIYRSGVIYKMSKLKNDWKVLEVEEFLKQNNIKLQAYELLRIFKLKYCK